MSHKKPTIIAREIKTEAEMNKQNEENRYYAEIEKLGVLDYQEGKKKAKKEAKWEDEWEDEWEA